jgi:hypothetical protein
VKRSKTKPRIVPVRRDGRLTGAGNDQEGGPEGQARSLHEPEPLPAGCRYTPLRNVKSAMGDSITP